MTLSSLVIGQGLLAEDQRLARQTRIDSRQASCACRESGLGFAAGAGLYALAWAAVPALHSASGVTDLLVGLGCALLAGVAGRIAGHVRARRSLAAELHDLHQALGHDAR